MRQLIQFLIRRAPFFLCLFYIGISLLLLFRTSYRHRAVLLGSTNRVVGTVYELTGEISGYFSLREINRELQARNGALEKELLETKSLLDRYVNSDELQQELLLHPFPFQFVPAEVIGNSTSRIANYITLDKGSRDGIQPEMGVVDHNGIVGIVSAVSERYAKVISLLNPDLRISCKVKGSDYFGSLVWDGKNPRYALLEKLPRHVVFKPGDTIVTSGFSSVFPEGLTVGYIESVVPQKNDTHFTCRIELSTDFGKLKAVRVLENDQKEELKAIEKQ